MNVFKIALIVVTAVSAAPYLKTPAGVSDENFGSRAQSMSERVAHWSAEEIRAAAQDPSPLSMSQVVDMVRAILPAQHTADVASQTSDNG
jgi:hypothetical protein